MQVVEPLTQLRDALEDAEDAVNRLRSRGERNPVIRLGLQEVTLEFDALQARVNALLELAEAEW